MVVPSEVDRIFPQGNGVTTLTVHIPHLKIDKEVTFEQHSHSHDGGGVRVERGFIFEPESISVEKGNFANLDTEWMAILYNDQGYNSGRGNQFINCNYHELASIIIPKEHVLTGMNMNKIFPELSYMTLDAQRYIFTSLNVSITHFLYKI